MGYSPDTSPHFGGFYDRGPGISSVGSYQIAGTPFMTGSTIASGDNEVRIDFPNVTRSITIINTDALGTDIRVHFASKDTGSTITGKHFITLNADQTSVTLNVKCKSIWLSNGGTPPGDADFQLFAEMTGINEGAMWTLTGAGIDA